MQNAQGGALGCVSFWKFLASNEQISLKKKQFTHSAEYCAVWKLQSYKTFTSQLIFQRGLILNFCLLDIKMGRGGFLELFSLIKCYANNKWEACRVYIFLE